MWRAAGDTATDFNHYSKRAILGAVYSASLLYWLDDDSEDQAATWDFIDRRIDGIMKFEKTKASAKQALARVPNPARFLGGCATRRCDSSFSPLGRGRGGFRRAYPAWFWLQNPPPAPPEAGGEKRAGKAGNTGAPPSVMITIRNNTAKVRRPPCPVPA